MNYLSMHPVPECLRLIHINRGGPATISCAEGVRYSSPARQLEHPLLPCVQFSFGSNTEKLNTSICFPLCPRTRTFLDAVGISQTCQFRTHAPQQRAILFDHSVCATKSPRLRASSCAIWCSPC